MVASLGHRIYDCVCMLTIKAASSASVQKIILRLAVVDVKGVLPVKGVLLGARGLLIAGVWGL